MPGFGIPWSLGGGSGGGPICKQVPPGILFELAGISWWGDLSGSLDIGGGTCLDEEMVGKWRLHGYAAARLRGYAAKRLRGYAATQLSGLALF